MSNKNETQSIKLPDGRTLAYATYGDQSGFPVLAFHGTPGSRLWFKEDDPVSLELGIRLITTDRPGYGLSTAKPGRNLLEYPGDVEVLLDQLEIEECSVIGTSGGSVFAAACGFALPDRVRVAGLVAGVAEFHGGRPPADMCRENRMAFLSARYVPFLAKLFLRYSRKIMLSQPENYIRQVQQQVSHLCVSDRAIMQDPENALHVLHHMQEAHRQGVSETVRETKMVTKPWGFNPEDIKTRVEIWHGTEDTLAPISSMEQLSGKLPDAGMNPVQGMGHFLDADPETWGRILKSLL